METALHGQPASFQGGAKKLHSQPASFQGLFWKLGEKSLRRLRAARTVFTGSREAVSCGLWACGDAPETPPAGYSYAPCPPLETDGALCMKCSCSRPRGRAATLTSPRGRLFLGVSSSIQASFLEGHPGQFLTRPELASQFPKSSKKLERNPALSFQRLVSKTQSLTVLRKCRE